MINMEVWDGAKFRKLSDAGPWNLDLIPRQWVALQVSKQGNSMMKLYFRKITDGHEWIKENME